MLLQVSLKIINYKVLLLVIIILRYCEYFDKCIYLFINYIKNYSKIIYYFYPRLYYFVGNEDLINITIML